MDGKHIRMCGCRHSNRQAVRIRSHPPAVFCSVAASNLLSYKVCDSSERRAVWGIRRGALDTICRHRPMAGRLLPKQDMRVRFPLSAPPGSTGDLTFLTARKERAALCGRPPTQCKIRSSGPVGRAPVLGAGCHRFESDLFRQSLTGRSIDKRAASP